jgi:hypothetical protein
VVVGATVSAHDRPQPADGVVVLSDECNGAWVQVDGDAKVLDVPEALDAFVEYFRNIRWLPGAPRRLSPGPSRSSGRLEP